jgi:sugar phosphate isomerase/epimerase
MNPLEIGVCGWSVDRANVLRGLRVAGGELGVHVAQIGFFAEAALRAAGPAEIAHTAKESGVRVAGLFVAFEGEDYSSIERVAATGGYLPDEHFEKRLAVTVLGAELARAIGCDALAVHAGTVPPTRTDPAHATLVERVTRVADAVAPLGVHLLLETGRESGAVLAGFLGDVDRANVAVNFDTGNFVLYGTDAPVSAARALKGRIRAVHLKDAQPSDAPGRAFGSLVPLGSGAADIPRALSKLRAGGYTGPLLVEADAARLGPTALRDGIAYLRSMLATVV